MFQLYKKLRAFQSYLTKKKISVLQCVLFPFRNVLSFPSDLSY